MATGKKIHIIITSVDFEGWLKPVPGGSFQGEDLQEVRELAKAFKKDFLSQWPDLHEGQVVQQESFFAMRHNRPDLQGIVEGEDKD